MPGTPIFANYAKRGGPPLESPCRWLSLVLSFASKESTIPRRGGSPIHSRRSRRVRPPPRGNFLRQSCLSSCKQGGFPLAPLHPLRIATRSNRAPLRAASPSPAPETARQAPSGAEVCACGRTKGLSSGQTIDAARTAVRPACCLPELRVANRLRRLYPLDTRFPSFPPAPLRIASEVN